MIRRLITFLIICTLTVFINSYPVEESKDTVVKKLTTPNGSENDKNESELQEVSTEKGVFTTKAGDVFVETKNVEKKFKEVKKIVSGLKEINSNASDKDKEVGNSDEIKKKDEDILNSKKGNDVNGAVNQNIKPIRVIQENNEEKDIYTKDNGAVKMNNNGEETNRHTKDNEDVKTDKISSKDENEKEDNTKENKNDSSKVDGSKKVDVTGNGQNQTAKDIVTELIPKSDFDLLQIIFMDAEVIEKRSTDVKDSESIINNPRDLEVAANTVFRPIFVYKRQNERKKFKPFPLLN